MPDNTPTTPDLDCAECYRIRAELEASIDAIVHTIAERDAAIARLRSKLVAAQRREDRLTAELAQALSRAA